MPHSKDMVDVYEVFERVGNCMICEKENDLRCGVCFSCSSQVDGKLVKPGIHKLWDCKNPENSWYFMEPGRDV